MLLREPDCSPGRPCRARDRVPTGEAWHTLPGRQTARFPVGVSAPAANDRGVIYPAPMETTSWWNCARCDVDVELVDANLTGYRIPCPDCGEPMIQWRQWDRVA